MHDFNVTGLVGEMVQGDQLIGRQVFLGLAFIFQSSNRFCLGLPESTA